MRFRALLFSILAAGALAAMLLAHTGIASYRSVSRRVTPIAPATVFEPSGLLLFGTSSIGAVFRRPRRRAS